MRYMTGRTEMTRTDPYNASDIVCAVGWDLINEWDSTGPVRPDPILISQMFIMQTRIKM